MPKIADIDGTDLEEGNLAEMALGILKNMYHDSTLKPISELISLWVYAVFIRIIVCIWRLEFYIHLPQIF